MSFSHYLTTTKWRKTTLSSFPKKIIKAGVDTHMHQIYHIWLWSVSRVRGSSERYVLRVAERMNQLNSCISFTIFLGGMCHLRFWCYLWSEAKCFCCFGSAVQVSAPRGTRKSFLIKKLYNKLAGIPRTQQQSHMKCVCASTLTAWSPLRACNIRELDH